MTLRHPYSFVPFPERLDRQAWDGTPRGHERFDEGLRSGSLVCTLGTITPLCLKAHFQACRFALLPPFLTGSSLKGMLRNTMQMLGFGCAGQQFVDSVQAKELLEAKIIDRLELGHMTPCTKESACMVCRLFGYGIDKPKGDKEDHEPFGYASKVRVLNSLPPTVWEEAMWIGMNDSACSVEDHRPAQLMNHGPRHKGFYYPSGGGKPAGWKIYRHATHVMQIDDGFASYDCVKRGTKFEFRIEFENLTSEEFALLEFAATLRHVCPVHTGPQAVSMVHKLGYGKSVGMGSCTVEITKRESTAIRRYFGQSGMPLEDQQCHLGGLFESNESQAFRDARGTSGADRSKILLLFPSYEEFDRPIVGSIDAFDKYLAASRFPVTLPPQPATRPPLLPEELPDEVNVRVTSIKEGQIRMETVDDFNGKKYSCRVAQHRIYINVEKQMPFLVSLRKGSVDHKQKTFEGSKFKHVK